MNKIFFFFLILSFFNTLCSIDRTTQGEKVQSCEKNDSTRINFNWNVDFTIKKSDIKKIGISLFTLYLIYHLIELKRIFSSCFTLKDDNKKIKYAFSGYPIAVEWFARYAIFTKNNSLLKKMLKCGACANFRDDKAMTLLEYALYLENQEAYNLLINFGASVSYALEPCSHNFKSFFPETHSVDYWWSKKHGLSYIGSPSLACFRYDMDNIHTYCVFLWPLSNYFRKIRLAHPPELIDDSSTYHYAHIPFIINNNLMTGNLEEWLEQSYSLKEEIETIFAHERVCYKTINRIDFPDENATGYPKYHNESWEKIDFTNSENFEKNYHSIVHSIIGCDRDEKTSKYFDIVYKRVKNYHEKMK